MNEIWDFLQYPFMQRALIAGILIGAICSALSVFVVLRRMAFVGHGISHSAFGGIALSLLLGWNPFIGSIIFCVLTGLFIGWVSQKKRVSDDSAIGIALTLTMALGSIFISLRQSYMPDIFNYLFGNILLVVPEDIPLIFAVCGCVALLLVVFFRDLYSFSFQEEIAWVDGLPVNFLRFLLILMLSFVIVISVKLIGIILVSSFLLIPGLIASQLSSKIYRIVLIAVVAGTSSVVIGLVVSFWTDMPSGAVIVIVQFICFLLAMFANRFILKTT